MSATETLPVNRRSASPSRPVRLGAAITVASSLIVLATIWLLPHPMHLGRIAFIEISVIALAVLLALVRPDPPVASPWLLVYPALMIVSVIGVTEAFPTAGGAYSGLFTLVFIYVGLSLRRGVSTMIVPVVAPAWYFCQTTAGAVTAVRTPIVIAIWIIVGELLATRTDVLASRIDQLVDDAHTDYLTGLGNRRGLSSALHGLVLNDIVILLDLDHFKRINDTRGHAAGDQVIRDFADTMRSVLRSSDGAFRYGGERRRDPPAGRRLSGGGGLLPRAVVQEVGCRRPTDVLGRSLHARRHELVRDARSGRRRALRGETCGPRLLAHRRGLVVRVQVMRGTTLMRWLL